MAKDENEGPKHLSVEDQEKATDKAEKAAAKAEYKPETAQEAAKTGEDRLHARSAKRAEDAGVVHPAFVDYESALENYEGREDVEPLAERRARENGTDFRSASFRRQIGGVDHTGVGTTDVVSDKSPKVTEGTEGTVGEEA